jgi:hypothetical protein
VTTAGFVSGTRDQVTPTRCSRAAALSSVLLGASLVAVLPVLTRAAFYVGVLAAASAALALVAGSVLWSRATLIVRTVAALAAGSTLLGELLQIFQGLPGARELGRLTLVEIAAALGLSAAVLALLLADALLHRPEQAPDHPYAL